MPIVLPGSPPVSTPPAGFPHPTLAEIEQELSRRVGPFYLSVGSALSVSVVRVPTLVSSVEQGGLDGLYILRRGAAVADDRQRLVASSNLAAGELTVDRPYSGLFSNEAVELCLLDPANELRRCSLRGLQRCYFKDRVTVTLAAEAAERDLTATRSWLTKPNQLLAVEYLPTGSAYGPDPVEWWKHFQSAGHLNISGQPDPFPDTMYVTALRPHSSWVNSADSTTGPLLDSDYVDADLDYAVTAAHKYAWETYADRLLPAARLGNKASQNDVERGWSKWVAKLPRPPDRIQLAYAP